MLRKYLPVFFLLLTVFKAQAQDPQFSQYYNAPLFLNPAFAGTADNTRAVLNYRTQWPGLYKPFSTVAFSFDHRIEPINSGVGLIIKNDRQGASRLNSTEIGAIYSYIVPFSEEWAFVPAIQTSFVNRSADFDDAIFGDQLDQDGMTGAPTNDILASGGRVSYLDFSTGGVIFSEFFWFGVEASHLNRPDQSVGTGTDRLPIKASFNAGYKILFGDPLSRTYRERSLIPTVLYKFQGLYDQLDIGVYTIFDPLMLGLWYRGLPIKKFNREYNNHEAIVLLAGVNMAGVTFAYSYDITISSLAGYSQGAHEISLIVEWYKKYKVKKRQRPIPCPKFYGGRLKH